MTGIFENVLMGFDTETTGTDVHRDRIVTAAVVYGENVKTWLINPGVEIPKEASDVHGVSTEEAREKGVNPVHALEVIAEYLVMGIKYGATIVAFNLAFDWTILDSELKRYGLKTIEQRLGEAPVRLVDPYVIDKAMDRYRKGKRKLGILAEHYGVKLENWHTADADALAAVLITEKLFEKYHTLTRLSPLQLYKYQQAWKREQMRGLEEYFDRMEIEHGYISRDWPLITGEEN